MARIIACLLVLVSRRAWPGCGIERKKDEKKLQRKKKTRDQEENHNHVIPVRAWSYQATPRAAGSVGKKKL